jgi:hypothetical protein
MALIKLQKKKEFSCFQIFFNNCKIIFKITENSKSYNAMDNKIPYNSINNNIHPILPKFFKNKLINLTNQTCFSISNKYKGKMIL